MASAEDLRTRVQAVDKRDYGAYQSLKGVYDYPVFRLIIEQIPKDPYAPPHTGVYRIQMNRGENGIIDYALDNRTADIAFRDYLARRFHQISDQVGSKRRGTGNSGLITINQPKQAILDRSCIKLTANTIEARCFLGLPANGRKINATVAATMLFEELPQIVEFAFLESNIDMLRLDQHIQIAEDSEYIRKRLVENGMVAFIANSAILPRASGAVDKPLAIDQAVSFAAPLGQEVEFDTPNTGVVKGLGIKEGVTLIVGGGYHGKSTLLNAIEEGIYNHIPGDGRELCVSHPDTVKVQAYSGRSIVGVNISPFIRNLPFQEDTSRFSSTNASGSTSQAANIIEAIEIGSKVILMDEDTCATNFMIRDQKMQSLVSKEDEPITTFIDRIRQLYEESGVSTILVLGGAGDYFSVADNVIQMKRYAPLDVTDKARDIARSSLEKRKTEDSEVSIEATERFPLSESVSPLNDYGKRSVYAKELQRFMFGKREVELMDVAHLLEVSQTKTIALAMIYAKQYMDGHRCMKEVVTRVIADIEEKGLDIVSDRVSGEFAQIRAFELAFALNRLRSLRVSD